MARTAFNIQPNPAQGSIEVRCNHEQAQAVLRIRDAAGRVVQEETFSGNTLLLDINGLRPGLFVVSLESVESRTYQRLVIE
ncbi:MAG: T9SS type A sorting domain-containing protein [Bacteroidetes bacterium]|nr:T9SS type A sorting domain-containing protein [Bacteroidota bacterium]